MPCVLSLFQAPHPCQQLSLTSGLDLAILATDPAYAGRGVGSLLLDWGCRLADQDGLECHLEATHAGYQLYKRKGFTEALGPDSAIYFDVSHLTGLGGEAGDWVDLTAMIRPPQSLP